MRLRFQYIMRCHQQGTLMRYYLLLSLPITLLPGSIIETPSPCGLILLTGSFQGGWSSIGGTTTGAIPMTTITSGTDDDLRLATATKIKTGWALHRQKGRWGLNLFLRCVTLWGSCLGTGLGYGVNVDCQIFVAPYLFSTTLLFIPPTVILRFFFLLIQKRIKVFNRSFYIWLFKYEKNRVVLICGK